MASRNFNLLRYGLKRADGKGKTYTFPQTPSSVVNASKIDGLTTSEQTVAYVYYSAISAGILGKLDVDFSGCDSEMDRIMRLFDIYTFYTEPLDDNGDVISDEQGEADPT